MRARCERGRAGRGRGARRHFWPVPRPAAGIRRGARDRHADLRGDHHGRRGRHGADRTAAGGRNAGGRFRPVRDRRNRQSGGEEPLHVRRPGPRAAGGAPADRHLERLGRAAFAIAGSLVRAYPGPGGGGARDPGRQLRPARGRDSLRRPGDLHGTQGIVGAARRGAACSTRSPWARRMSRATAPT